MLKEQPGISSDYKYVTHTLVGTCHYKVNHDLSSKYQDKDSIVITDKQVVTDYDYPSEDNVKNIIKQKVTYEFEKDSDGNYYLKSVNVK